MVVLVRGKSNEYMNTSRLKMKDLKISTIIRNILVTFVWVVGIVVSLLFRFFLHFCHLHLCINHSSFFFLLSYDEFYLNQCVIEKEGARLAGVLVNKCAPKKVDQVHQYLEKAMAPFDVPILGVVPDREFFESPCARDFEQLFNTKLMAGTDFRNRHFTEVRLASCSTRHFLSTYRKSSPATLWVIHASRTDLILALKSAAQEAEYQNRHDPNCKLEKKIIKQDCD